MSVQDDVYRIRHATYGEEVRESIADAIEGMNVKVEATEEARQDAINAAEQAEEYRDETQQIVDDAVDDIYERVVEEVVPQANQAASGAYLHAISSGAVISINDGADNVLIKSMKINIKALQDLHGFDYPWFSDGGQNMYTMGLGEVQIGLFISPSTHSINPLNSSTYQYRSFLFRCKPNTKYVIRSGINSTVRVGSFSSKPVLDSVATRYADGKGLDTPTEVKITTGSSDTYLFMQIFADTDVPSGTTMEEYYSQALSGFFVSPNSNICPISGWTGAQIEVAGGNLYDATKNTDGFYYDANLQWTENSSVTITDYMAVADVVRIVLASVSNNPVNLRVNWFDSGKNIMSQAIVPTQRNVLAYTANVPNDAAFVRISTNPELSPFAAITSSAVYSVSWETEAGTVFGGTIRDNGDGTWTLTVTHRKAQVKDFGWTREQVSGASFYRFFVYLDGKAVGLSNIICEALQTSNAAYIADLSDNSIRGASTSTIVSIRADAFSTVEELKNETTGIGNAAIVYELATPVSYTISAESVKTLLGMNNIFADCGDISELIYRVDPNIAAAEKVVVAVTDAHKAFPHAVASGSVASFTDGADDIPVRSLTAQIIPVQSGSGDPSPDNVRPISGWTGAQIEDSHGDNFVNPADFYSETTEEQGVYTYNVSGYNACLQTGQSGAGGYAIEPGDYKKLIHLPAGDYVYSFKAVSGGRFSRLAKVDPVTGVRTTISASETIDGDYYSYAFTLSEPAMIALVRTTNTRPSVFSEMQLERGTVRTAFKPYSGASYTISWQSAARTVYGGMLRDNGDDTWTLTATWAGVNLAALTWTPDAEHGTFSSANLRTGSTYKYIQQINTSASASVVARVEKYNPISLNDMTASYPDNSFAVTTIGNIIVKADASPSGFLAYLIKNGQPLPEYTLTADSVKTLLGDNNIFADTGDVSVDYRADTTLYIDGKVNEIMAAIAAL